MPDVAQVTIINSALFQLGQEPVADLSDASLQGSVAAVKLLRVMEEARDTVLRRHGWNCALNYRTLSPVVLANDPPNWRYPTTFLVPGDGLRVWEIENLLECFWGPRWQVNSVETQSGSQMVVRAAAGQGPLAGASVDDLNVAYIRRCNWASLDAHLRDAIAFDLAARGCYSVTGARDKALDAKAEAKVLMAVSSDATQEGGQPPLAPSIPQALRNLSR